VERSFISPKFGRILIFLPIPRERKGRMVLLSFLRTQSLQVQSGKGERREGRNDGIPSKQRRDKELTKSL
jgi:hypothetical protein